MWKTFVFCGFRSGFFELFCRPSFGFNYECEFILKKLKRHFHEFLNKELYGTAFIPPRILYLFLKKGNKILKLRSQIEIYI